MRTVRGRFPQRVSRVSRPVRWGLLAVVLAMFAACGPVVSIQISSGPPPGGPGSNRLVVGATHTEFTADPGLPAAQFDAEMAVLGRIPVQNQHLMGWGAVNPEPWPGQYNWTSLDHRVALIEQAGAEPVLTLCCSPDWMKGGAPGTTDWARLAEAPDPAHIGDFATLAAAAAIRYPQIKRFQVWNEMKGFYDPTTNNWNSAAYTNLYNAVYDAVKAARPDAQVGGPYAPLDIWSDPATMSNPSVVRGPWGVVDQRPLDVITYWLAHSHGADFISLDGWTSTRDAGFITDPFEATGLLTTMTQWVRARTNLPIWWPELHVSDPSWPLAKQDAVTTVALARLAESGAALALLWQPQAEGPSCRSCLWSDPSLGAVQATPLAASVTSWAECVPVGSKWREAVADDPTRVFVTATERGALVVNRTGASLDVSFQGTSITLAPYAVKSISDDARCQR